MTPTLGIGTCNLNCWMAREDECRCMCGGANHGVMSAGGDQPGRYMKRKGTRFELVEMHDTWTTGNRARDSLNKTTNSERGREFWRESVIMTHATSGTLKWPEVKAFLAGQAEGRGYQGAKEAYLIWKKL